jgi:hypothetical protein
MLEVVGHPVAVNPDRELRQVAEERGWEVLGFRNPVRLRTRFASAVPPARTGIVAAAVGMAVLAGVVVWVTVRSRRVRPPV